MLRLTNTVPACFFLILLFIITLSGYQAKAQCVSFPNTPICAGDACNTAPTQFLYTGATAPGPGVTYFWDFGDPNVTTDADTTTVPTASYSYTQPGNYTVQVIVSVNGVNQAPCSSNPVPVLGFGEFTIGPMDENLGPQEEEFCKEDVPQTLSPVFRSGSAPANAIYLWSGPGVTDATKTNSSISITEEGCYSLEITDPSTNCTRINKLNVRLYKPDPSQPTPQTDQARWYFGTNAGIRFPGGQPTAVSGLTFRNINAPEGSSSVLNSKGQLLFYTDGITVFDSTGTAMQDVSKNPPVAVTTPRELDGGNGLNGSTSSTQTVTIVPQPGCNDCQSVYYVFTTSEITTTATGSQLSYSVVDMRLKDGLGQVIQKNIPLSGSSTERVISVQGNPSDPNAPATTWIITHDFASNTFRVYPLTPQGVGTPETYDVGTSHGPETVKGEGYMKISSDGSKLAVVIPGANGAQNVVEVFDFDTTTGEVSNPLTLNLGTAPPTAYGLEFSGDQLYVSLRGNATNPSQLVRYNVSLGDSLLIALSKDTLATSNQEFGGLQAGPDQKIYMAIKGRSSLGVVNNPNATDLTAVDFEENGFAITGGTSGLGLPNNSPSTSQSYGQSFGFDGPQCAELGEQVQYQFQAQPDRAGGDPTKSTYLWSIDGTQYTTVDPTHSFPGPGTYTVELTIFNDCIPEGEVIPAQTITILQSPPAVNLGPNKLVCTGTAVTLDAYTNATGPAGATYFWTQPNGVSVRGGETFVVPAGLSGAYRVTVLVGQCVEIGTVNVNFSGPPANFLGNDTTLCQPGSTLLLNAGSPGSTYRWNTGATTQTITVSPNVTTTYSVTVTDPLLPTCSVPDQITITISQPTQVTFTKVDAADCAGSNGSINLTVPATGGPFTFAWTKEGVAYATTEDITGTPGVYNVVVTNAAGCTTSLSIPINSTSSTLQATASSDNISCSEATGTLTVTQTGGPAIASYVWTRNGQPIAANTAQITEIPGVYAVEITDITGCKFSIPNLEIRQEAKPTVTASFTQTGCQNGTVTAVSSGVAGATFQWFRNNVQLTETTPSINITSNGAYKVRVSNPADATCSTESTVNVIFPTPPAQINLATPAAVCAGTPVILNATTAGYTTYIWTLPNNTTVSGAQITATIAGRYTVRGRNALGCVSEDFVDVVINPTPAAPAASNPAPVCSSPTGGIPQLTATGQNIRWYSNATLATQVGSNSPFLPTITGNGSLPGTFTFFVTQTVNGCQSPARQVTLTINRSPLVNLGSDRTICIDDSVLLDATNSGATYRWSTTETTPTIRPTRTGTYSVTVTIGNCVVTDEVVLTVLPSIRTNVPNREVALCTDAIPVRPVTLDAGPGEGFTYFWPQLNSRERTAIASQPGVYEVIISDASNCSKTEQITVVNKCEPQVFVPDAFSPNGDSQDLNNTFKVFGGFVSDFEMQVFNRWGEIVFSTKAASLDQAEFWDGNYLGKPAPVGSYAWKISYKSVDFPDRDAVVKRGGVMLIR
ncbi:PKD domain-containing protein [Rhodocytophaga rosea]|uniref:PKD domain-containing protein n=1 Tax=Rhodocytophaga rosea TaxID=2704465 RepID=A0A6C0GUZ6_9BACT|nr:PKD domain-containing protein [Rhodocytophaga rosea]QHT71162.1 PKD domain-containing protein [Rhodocytophaga rosea]